jgi:uncharacterized protein (DUF1697 family)
MADLRSLSDVRTYIQGGNVIFSSPKTPDVPMLEAAIEERFAIKSDVVLRSASELEAAVKHNPFSVTEEVRVHVGFLAMEASEAIVAALDHPRFGPDRFAIVGSEAYLYLPVGTGLSKLLNYLIRQLRTPVTMRNWNTLNKLVELAAQ